MLEVVAEAYNIVAFVHFAESHVCLKKCDNQKKKADTSHNLNASWPGRILLYIKIFKKNNCTSIYFSHPQELNEI